MRLIKVSIDGYKHLKGTCVNFSGESHEVMFTGDTSIRFFCWFKWFRKICISGGDLSSVLTNCPG